MISFLRLINSPVSGGTKAPTDLKRWAFFGSGPAITVRAIARIKGILSALGMDISNLRFFDLDFSNNMLYEGRRAIEQISPQLDYNPLYVDIINQTIPLDDGSIDVAETGIIGTIGEEGNTEGVNKKVHLFLELNRVLGTGGYLILTVKNKPLPQAFQDALVKYFGFRIITPSQPDLDYDKDDLTRITGNDTKKADKLKAHLQGASYLVAVKERTLSQEEIQLAIDSQKDYINAFQYDDSYEAQTKRAKTYGYTLTPQEIDMVGIDYGQIDIRRYTGIDRETIMYDPAYEPFEDNLACLIYFRRHLSAPQQRLLDEIVSLWDKRHASFLTEDQVKFVMETPAQVGVPHTKAIQGRQSLEKQLEPPLKERIDAKRQEIEREHLALTHIRRYNPDAVEREVSRYARDLRQKTTYTLSQLYEEENHYRSTNKIPAVFEQVRAPLAKSVRQIKLAVAALKAEGKTPSLEKTAHKIGKTRQGLSGWARVQNIDLVKLGVVHEYDPPVDKSKRIQKIQESVLKLKSSGKEPTLDAVAAELQLGVSYLLDWARRNEVNLTALGVWLIDPEKVREAIAKLRGAGKSPYLVVVAKMMKLEISVFIDWAAANNINLTEYFGIIPEIDPEIIRMAVELVKKDGKVPYLSRVAAEIGIESSILEAWAVEKNVSLTEDFGIVVLTFDRIVDSDFEQSIKLVVAQITQEGGVPYIGEVARRLGYKTLAGVANRAERNNIDLQDLGVVPGRRRVDDERQEALIRAAVANLLQKGLPVSIEAVSREMGYKQSNSLYQWAERRGYVLKDFIKEALSNFLFQNTAILVISDQAGASQLGSIKNDLQVRGIDVDNIEQIIVDIDTPALQEANAEAIETFIKELQTQINQIKTSRHILLIINNITTTLQQGLQFRLGLLFDSFGIPAATPQQINDNWEAIRDRLSAA